jgi:hypothetical protein
MYGVAFAGDADDEQWIERVVIDSVEGIRILEVTIRKDIGQFERAKEPLGSLETIEAKVPWHSDQPILFDEHGSWEWGNFILAGETLAHESSQVELDVMVFKTPSAIDQAAPKRAGVLVTTPVAKFVIVSSSAHEMYYVDDDDKRALQYAHLDVEFLHMDHPAKWGGLLPEVWGNIRNMIKTNATVAPTALRKQILESMLEPTGNFPTTARVCSGNQCEASFESSTTV